MGSCEETNVPHLQTLKHRCVTILKTLTPSIISCLAVHNTLLYAASANKINVFDLSNYTHIDTFTTNDPSSGSIKSIAFNNKKVFTAHQDCKIRVWRISLAKQHHLIFTLPTVKDRFRHFILPRNYVAVRRHHKRLWIEHCDAISGLVMNGGLMYSVSWDKSFKIWSMKGHRCLESIKAHDDAVNTIVVSGNGTVYTGSADGLIKVWEKGGKERKHSLVATLEKHRSTVNALALNCNGTVLFSGGCDRSILVWERRVDNTNHMVCVEALCGHKEAILCLINKDTLLISGSSDRTVRIWQRCQRNRYNCTVILGGHEKPVKSLVVVPRSVLNRFCNENLDEDIKVWEEIPRGLCNEKFLICSGSLDGEIKVWEVSTH